MKKSELRAMISVIVEEEIRKLAPVIVEEFLTEKYLRGIVLKESAKRPPSKKTMREMIVGDMTAEEEDRIPEPPENDHQGIYDDLKSNNMEESNNRIVSKLLSKDNPNAYLFEGVKPIPMDHSALAEAPQQSMTESQRMFGPDGVPIDKIPDFTSRMRKLVKNVDQRAAAKAPMKNSEAAEERRLAQLRAKLDEQVVGARPKVV